MELGEEIDTFPSDNVTGIIEFLPCGKYLSCCGKEDMIIWDINNRKLCKGETYEQVVTRYIMETKLSLPEECKHVDDPAFSSCGQYLACLASWNKVSKNFPICLFDVVSGKHLVTFRGHTTEMQILAFSPDNKLLASASHDGTVLLWDLTPYL